MTYRAPVDDIMHALKTAAGLDQLIERGLVGDLDEATIRAVIEEAGKFGAEVLEPLSAPGDRAGSKLVDGKVVTPPGWKEAYQQFAAGGWGALPAPEEWGGQSLPQVVGDGGGRDVELGQHGLRPLPAAHPGRDRCARGARLGGAEGDLSCRRWSPANGPAR